MASLFRRDKPIRPAYATPPTELPNPGIEAQIADVDRKLLSIAVFPRSERGQGPEWQTDRLLDLRNAIRPAKERKPPVVPGRAEASIENYQENPW
jgi:hypothetical protein